MLQAVNPIGIFVVCCLHLVQGCSWAVNGKINSPTAACDSMAIGSLRLERALACCVGPCVRPILKDNTYCKIMNYVIIHASPLT